jgi:hypothetical protein
MITLSVITLSSFHCTSEKPWITAFQTAEFVVFVPFPFGQKMTEKSENTNRKGKIKY